MWRTGSTTCDALWPIRSGDSLGHIYTVQKGYTERKKSKHSEQRRLEEFIQTKVIYKIESKILPFRRFRLNNRANPSLLNKHVKTGSLESRDVSELRKQ